MAQLPAPPDDSAPLRLDSQALHRLIDRLCGPIEVPHGWKPRKAVESFATEAFFLASLLDEAPTGLLPHDSAQHLREMALAVRALHAEAERLRSDRSYAVATKKTRKRAQRWFSEVLAALKFLASAPSQVKLRLQLAKVNSRESTDDGKAMQLDLLTELSVDHEPALLQLGLELAWLHEGLSLAQALREISAKACPILDAQQLAYERRNALLFTLKERLQHIRATLRFVHRADREWLKRISR